jgi:hypothetical protein
MCLDACQQILVRKRSTKTFCPKCKEQTRELRYTTLGVLLCCSLCCCCCLGYCLCRAMREPHCETCEALKHKEVARVNCERLGLPSIATDREAPPTTESSRYSDSSTLEIVVTRQPGC